MKEGTAILNNIEDNGLSGNISDVVVRTGKVLRSAYDILSTACIIMRKIYHILEERDKKNFIKMIEEDSKGYILPVMDVYDNPEKIVNDVLNIFDQIDPKYGQLFIKKYDYKNLMHKDKRDFVDKLRATQMELFFETARDSERILLGLKNNKLKLKLNQLGNIWNGQIFQQVKTILINDCDLACKQTKEFISFVEEKFEQFQK